MILQRVVHGTLNLHDRVYRVADEGASGPVVRPGCHSHEAWEVFCPLRGEFQFESGEEVRTYPEGSLLLVSPGCLHIKVNLLDQPPEHELLVLNLPGDQARYGTLRVSDAKGTFRSTFSEPQLQRWTELVGDSVENLMSRVATTLDDKNLWQRERAVSLLRLLFAGLGGVVCEDVEKPARTNRGEEAVTETLALIETHYYDVDLTVGAIAETAGVSASHLTALFRQITGQTLHQKLIATRLRHAVRLLTETNRSIKEIAALTGWRNQLYFSNVFRRRFGLAPTEARCRDDWMRRQS